MQDLLGLGDSKRIKAVAGLAGGIGHQAAVCGILTGGSLALALVSAQSEEDQATIAARQSTLVNEYVNEFTRAAGSTLCREIAQTDFSIDNEVRKYMLIGARRCVKLASRAAEMLVNLINKAEQPGLQQFDTLNQNFAQKNFQCAYSVISQVSEKLEHNQLLGPALLIPFNGGIGYSGTTCAALLGGCMAIGLVRGGDASEGGMSSGLKRIFMTLLRGSSAYSRIDLSPANDALLRCGELFSWFQTTYGTHLCRGLTHIDFGKKEGIDEFFGHGIERCKMIASETAAKAAELAK